MLTLPRRWQLDHGTCFVVCTLRRSWQNHLGILLSLLHVPDGGFEPEYDEDEKAVWKYAKENTMEGVPELRAVAAKFCGTFWRLWA